MARYKIFISYSKKDKQYLEAFKNHLKPFDNNAELSVWSDQEIGAGANWDREIHDAMGEADAAVLLVSPDFLATDYVVDEEIPFLIEREASGTLVLAPFFIRAANVQAKIFDGDIKLTDFQGLNRPDQPIASLGDAERDARLAEAANKLWEQLEKRENPRERRQTTSAKALTVELKLRGRHLDRSYSKAVEGTFLQNGMSLELDRLESLGRTGDRETVGERLFELLFGSEREWSAILPKALGKPGTPAAHFGVRTRILAHSPELQDLPWSSCHWQRQSLAEQAWTFELVDRRETPKNVWLEAPCSALMIGGEIDGEDSKLCAEAHWASFQGLVQRAWNHPANPDLRWVPTADEALAALAEGPRLVYVFAYAREGGKGLEILLPDADGRPRSLAFDELTAAIDADHPPMILVVSTFGSCPLVPALPGVAVVVHLRHEAAGIREGFEARRQGMTFWSDVLQEGWDPVKAFHELGPDARHDGRIRTDYDHFETRVADHTPKIDRARSRLDRRPQREAVMSLIRDLVGLQNRRVTCVVAYGSPGNMVEHFSVQVRDTLKDWARGTARLEHHPLAFPNGGGAASLDDFETHLRDYLHLQWEQELAEGFSKPRRGGPTASPVHFIDWGSYGVDGRDVPDGPALQTWLTFCCDRLGAAVTGRERILSYIALVLPPERHAGLCEFLDSQSQQEALKKTHFHVQHLQPLKKITPQDLRTFLADDENTSCHPEYRDEIAERICVKTGGEFEATVKFLEDAERTSWYDLLDWLRLEQDKKPSDIDPLLLTYRLVLAGYATPELLQTLETRPLLAAARKAAQDREIEGSLRKTLETLEDEQGGRWPNALWLSWMQNTRAERLETLREELRG